jgi:hypothetical protein
MVRDIVLNLDIKQVLRRQGIAKNHVRPGMLALAQELVHVAEIHLLKPLAAYNIYPVVEVTHDEIHLNDFTVIKGGLLSSVLKQATELVTVVCTIGAELEQQVTAYLAENEVLKGVLLDSIGSAAVDSTLREFGKLIANEAVSRGYNTSRPLSPGIPGFPLSEQQRLLELSGAREVGVSLTSSVVMKPRKSISAVIGVGPDMPIWKPTDTCKSCNLKNTCSYRTHA